MFLIVMSLTLSTIK